MSRVSKKCLFHHSVANVSFKKTDVGEEAKQMHKRWVTINIICLKWHKTILGRMKCNKTIPYFTRKQMNRGWLIEEDLDSGILGDTEGSIGAHCVKELKENSRK